MRRTGPPRWVARREELTLRALFYEELGAVVQVPTGRRDEALRILRAHGLGRASHAIGKTNERGIVEVWRDARVVFAAPLRELHQVWDEVSWRIARLRDNPACADAEHDAAGRADDPGLHVHVVAGAARRAGGGVGRRGAAEGGGAARAGRQQPRRAQLRDGPRRASTPTTCT